MGKEIDMNDILKALRDQIGMMGQEIAVLKATIEALEKEELDGNNG